MLWLSYVYLLLCYTIRSCCYILYYVVMQPSLWNRCNVTLSLLTLLFNRYCLNSVSTFCLNILSQYSISIFYLILHSLKSTLSRYFSCSLCFSFCLSSFSPLSFLLPPPPLLFSAFQPFVSFLNQVIIPYCFVK